MLLSHTDGRSHSKLFKPLLARLTDQGSDDRLSSLESLSRWLGFLTDDLVIQEDGTQQKYLGVCKLPGEGKKVNPFDYLFLLLELTFFLGSIAVSMSSSFPTVSGRAPCSTSPDQATSIDP